MTRGSSWILWCSGDISLVISHVADHFATEIEGPISAIQFWLQSLKAKSDRATKATSTFWQLQMIYCHMRVMGAVWKGKKIIHDGSKVEEKKGSSSSVLEKQKSGWSYRVLDRVSGSSISGQRLPSCTILTIEKFIFSSKQNASVLFSI